MNILPPKPKREDFTLHHSDYPLFKDDEFAYAERDYYKAVSEHQDQYLFSIASGNVGDPRTVAQACLDAIKASQGASHE